MLKYRLKIFFDLIKIKITIAVAFTTAVGYFLAADKLSFGILAPIMGIFLLASGASALNEYQERKTDGLMHRTKDRPLPAAKIQTKTAILIIIVLVVVIALLAFLIWILNRKNSEEPQDVSIPVK